MKKENILDIKTDDLKRETLNKIMMEYGDEILRLVYSYVKNRTVAEDLTQLVFMKCFENLDYFRGDSSLKTWLCRIAVNCTNDYFKSWNFKYTFLTDKIHHLFNDKSNSPEELVVKGEDYRHVKKCVLSLPVKYREVIFLHYFEDLSLKEISELLSLNLNTVKSRHIRAKVLLMGKLTNGG